jgi:hypothetical protein
MNHIRLFESFEDHPILDFFQEIIDDGYDVKIQTNGKDNKIEISILNLPMFRKMPDEITPIMNELKNIKTSSQFNWNSMPQYIRLNVVSSYLKETPIIKRIENTIEYFLYDFRTSETMSHRGDRKFSLYLVFFK